MHARLQRHMPGMTTVLCCSPGLPGAHPEKTVHPPGSTLRPVPPPSRGSRSHAHPRHAPGATWPDTSGMETCSHSVTSYKCTGPALPACRSAACGGRGRSPVLGAAHRRGTERSCQLHRMHTPGPTQRCSPHAVLMEGFGEMVGAAQPTCPPLQRALAGHYRHCSGVGITPH